MGRLPLIAAGLAMMVFFPKITPVIPTPLVSIVILTVSTVGAAIAVPIVGDKGALPSAVPVPGLPDVPVTLDTLTTIAPVVIDLSAAHIWEASSVAALDEIETKYAQRGKTVEITGLNDPSADLHGKLTGELAGSY